MSLQKQPTKRLPVYLIVGIVLLVVFGVVFILTELRGQDGSTELPSVVAKAYFTIDDGKTWFADDAQKLSPFQYDQKTAYRCYVWTCDGGKTKFVSHLERLKPEARRKAETLPKDSPSRAYELAQIEVKPPFTGDNAWVDVASPAAVSITTPHCPAGGKSADLRELRP